MSTFFRLLVVVLLAACLWWILGSQPQPEVDSGTTANAGDGATEQTAGTGSGDAEAERAMLPDDPDDPDGPDDEEETTKAPASELAHVRGRCVAAENGAPLSGCRVSFSGRASDSAQVASHGDTKWQTPEPTVTGADGRFDIAFAAMPPFQHSLNIEAPDRAPRTGRWGAFRPGQIEDLGDIPVQHGYTVSGHVVDTAGAPVKDAHIGVGKLPLPIRDDMGANDSRGGHSDAKGFFRMRVPIPAGSWPLRAGAAGMKLVEPDTLVVPRTSSDRPLRVVLRRLPSIRGRCVDGLGRPMANVYVEARIAGSGRTSADWSDKDGSFTLYNPRDDQSPVVIETSRGNADPMVTEQGFAWGTAGVRLVLKRNLELNLTVVEKDSRRPVERFAVSCQQVSTSNRGLRLGGFHAGGKVVVDHVIRGQNRIHVVAKDRALRMVKSVEFLAQDPGIPDMTIEMERMPPREVLVVDAAGTPMVGSRIELIRRGDRELRVDSFMQDPVYDPTSAGIATKRAQRLSEAVTDAAGRATFPAPDSSERTALRITGPTHVARLEPDVVFPGNDALRIVVDRGGRLSGSVILKSIDASKITLRLTRVDGRRVMQGDGGAIAIDADGSFDVAGLAPGEYRASMGIVNRYETDSGGGGATRDMPLRPVSFRISEGDTRELRIDLSSCAPATIRGRVLLDGQPAFGVRVFLRELGSSMFQYGQYTPDREGRFTATGVMPGKYTLGLVVDRSGGTIYTDSPFTVTAGQQADPTFQLRRRKVRVQITDAKDRPIPGMSVHIRSATAGKYWSLRCKTDESGWITLDPAPAGRLELRPRGNGAIDPIELPAGKSEVTVRRVLKPKSPATTR